MSANEKQLIAIVEQGGYPNFAPLYQRLGFKVTMVYAMRKAMTLVRKIQPDVIVAEFNYQSQFRDRTSSLESLLATVERLSESGDTRPVKVIVFYEKEYADKLAKLQAMFKNFETLAYPIEEHNLAQMLE
jgi:hypothetical protein